MSDKYEVQLGGIGFWLLGLLFVGLKLTDHIDWSWWWVLLPFYGSFLLFLTVFFIAFTFLIVADFIKGK